MQQVRELSSRMWTRYKGMSRRAQIILAAVVVLVVCGGLGSALGSGKSPKVSPTATVGHVKLTSTATPSGPQPVTGARLGGSNSAFAAKFGSPTQTGNEVRDYTATINGQSVFIRAMLLQPGDTSRVRFIDVKPADSGATWDLPTAEAIAKTFLPQDATYLKDLQVQDFGTENLYMSKDLATTFPSADFSDASTNALVTPGTFYISCGNTNESNGGCSLQLGQ